MFSAGLGKTVGQQKINVCKEFTNLLFYSF